MKRNFYLVMAVICSVLLTFTSCVSSSNVSNAQTKKTETTAKATLAQTPERFFWEISGKDAKGNDSKVYIQGTIHLGTKELFPFSETVLQAFNNADRYVSELSEEDVKNSVSELQLRIAESFQKTDGKKLSDALTEEETEYLRKVLTAIGTKLGDETFGAELFNLYDSVEPWGVNLILTDVLYGACNYDSSLGLDLWFYKQLGEQGKTWAGLDSLETQMDILSFGTYDEQLFVLKDTIEHLTNLDKTQAELKDLFDAYINNDLTAFSASINKSMKVDFAKYKSFAKKYYAVSLTNRNKAWAKKIAAYLNEGGTTFIFAGSAHFVGNDSVFTYLKKNKTIN